MIIKNSRFYSATVVCLIIGCLLALNVTNINEKMIVKLRHVEHINMSEMVAIKNANATEKQEEISACEVGTSCPCGGNGSECTITINGTVATVAGKKD
ncbi:hypothetical protein [Pedobacter mendelii]|uniref:Uncharacterized protein n=2 Tax=Pedobacter mendelii TaxID=1908240 RepID=A0ABQ2BKN7_9SPHI|nr:hypothetical protein [Pedobacter mendelii]GGI26544.1 hypothetical protein GCM10008119_23180 [Pedobacter mendelii]